MADLRRRSGFTLIELVVVVLVVGILAAIAVPTYFNSVQNEQAQAAATLVRAAADANRQFAVDHGGIFTIGVITNACNAQTNCPTANGLQDPCNLVACRYLQQQDWDAFPYAIATNPGGIAAMGVAPSGPCGSGVACAYHRNGCALSGSYCSWSYATDPTGATLTAQGGAPDPAAR